MAAVTLFARIFSGLSIRPSTGCVRISPRCDGTSLINSIGPQAESWVVVDEQIQVIREPMVKIAAGRGGSTREVEVGLDGVDDLQDPILQRIERVEEEGPVHLQLFGVMRRQPLDQEVEPTATARRANPCPHERPAFNEAPVPKQSDDLAIGRVLQQTSGCPLLVQPSERRTP